MKLAIIGIVCLISLVAAQTDEEWAAYKAKYNKVYRSGDDVQRKEVWKANLKFIDQHNSEAAKGKHSYFLGENQFADLTFDEFKKQYLSSVPPPKDVEPVNYHYATGRRTKDFVDLRAQGLVAPIRNQGSCGSCWAFSSVVALEGAFAKKTGTIVELSEQQLVDCVKASNVQGCSGGWMNPVFEHLQNNGIQSRSSYPYTATNGSCKADTTKNVLYTADPSYKTITASSHSSLQDAIEAGNVVSVAVYADSTFQLYKSGVYNRANSFIDNLLNLNHAIAIVGYDYTVSTPYYIAKNSWDTTWGESGYMRMDGTKDTAGILSKGSYPLIK